MPHADADFVRDTGPKGSKSFLEIQRRRTPEQKLNDVFDLSDGLFEMTKAGVRLRHPEADEREVFLRAVAMKTRRDLMINAHGWDPALHE